MKAIKIIVIIVVGLISLALLAGAAVVFYVQSANHKELVRNLIRDNAKMGSEVGSASISLFPVVKVDISDLKIKPFSGEQNVLEVSQIVVRAKPLKLISGRFESLRVVAPQVFLHRDATGKANWESPRKSRHSKGGSFNPLQILAFGDVSVEKGGFSYISEPERKEIVATDLGFSIKKETERKRSLSLSTKLNDVPVNLNGRVNISGALVPVEMVLKAAENNIEAKGTMDMREFSFNGAISADTKTLAATLVKFGLLTPGVVKDLPIIFSTQAQLSEEKMNFTDMQMAAGPYSISGSAGLVKNKKGWHTEAQLNSDSLNLDEAGLCGKPEINKNKKGGAPWSTHGIDMTPLQQYTFDVDVALNNLVCDGKKYSQLRVVAKNDGITVNLAEGRLEVGNDRFANLTGRLHVSQSVRGSAEVEINNLPLQHFLPANMSDKIDFPIFGEGAFTFDGTSTQAWAESLNGSLDVTAKDGRMVGVSLKDLAGGLKNFLDGKGAGREFKLFKAGYDIEKGVARVREFALDAGDLTISAEGKVDLANWTINHRLIPTAQGFNIGKVTNLSLPVIVKGPLNDPSIRPDMTSAEGIGAGVGAAIGGPVGAAAGAILGGMVRGGEEEKEEGAEPQEEQETPPALNLQTDPEALRQNVKDFLKNGVFGN